MVCMRVVGIAENPLPELHPLLSRSIIFSVEEAMLSILRSIKRLLIRRVIYFGKEHDYLRSQGVKVGRNCHFSLKHVHLGSEPWLVQIGDNVTITRGVSFITHDGSTRLFRAQYPDVLNKKFGNVYAPIIVHDNCFIGVNTIVMPGVTIGPDSIVGAGSIVTRDVPPRTIAVGNPAKVIKTLDDYIARHLENHLIVKASNYEELRAELTSKFFGSKM